MKRETPINKEINQYSITLQDSKKYSSDVSMT
jgi:hypothetical protein